MAGPLNIGDYESAYAASQRTTPQVEAPAAPQAQKPSAWETIKGNLWAFVSSLEPKDANRLAEQSAVFVGPQQRNAMPPSGADQPAIMQHGMNAKPLVEPFAGTQGPPAPPAGFESFVGPVGDGSRFPAATPFRPENGNPTYANTEKAGWTKEMVDEYARDEARKAKKPVDDRPGRTRAPAQAPEGRGGADVSRTGTATNPTGKMDDDDDLRATKQAMERYLGREQELDLSPVMALTDSWVKGSNLSQGYKRPMSGEERAREELQLRTGMADKQADLKYKKAYLTQQTEAAKAAEAFRRDKLAQDGRLAELRIKTSKANKGAGGGTVFGSGKEDKALGNWSKDKAVSGALQMIAKGRYGKKMDDGKIDPEGPSGKEHIPKLRAEIWNYGKWREEHGYSEPGQGLTDSLEEYLANPLGPDGGGASHGAEEPAS